MFNFKLDRKTINLLHVALIAPFLMYVGYLGMNAMAIPNRFFQALVIAGALAALYHGSKFLGLMEGMILSGKQKEEEIVPIKHG